MSSSSAAARSAPGARGSSSAAGSARVVLLEAGTLGKGASSRAAGMVRAQGGTETAVRLGMFSRDFYRSSTTCSASTPASSPRATSCRASPRPRWPRRTPGSRCSAASVSTSAGCRRTSSTTMNPTVARGMTLGSSYAAGDGYIDPPSNVLAYTAALFTAVSRSSSGRASPGLTVDGGSVTGVRDRARCDQRAARGADRRPDAGRGRSRGRRPRSSPAARGTRSWSPKTTPTSRRLGCRWCSTSRPASTGGPRRAG